MKHNCIRIFISSTFSDFTQEREVLNKRVFPKLKAYCREHGFLFQSIDLRWGISEEAATEQDTIRICLEEIERCQTLSPAPNFFLLLGNRYGWQPLPYEFPAETLAPVLRILESMGADRNGYHPFELFQKWYRLDKNALPAKYILQPKASGSDFEKESDLLLEVLQFAALHAGLSKAQQDQFFLSATAFEILKGTTGLSTVKKSGTPVICFFREISEIQTHVDVHDKKIELLQDLKTRLKGHYPQFTFHLKIGKRHTKKDYLNAFAQKSEEILKRAIDKRMQETNLSLSNLELENLYQQDFARIRRDCFVGREAELETALSYISVPKGQPLLVYGTSGMGKSAFSAQLSHIFQAVSNPSFFQVTRFVGATPNSSHSLTLIRDLCQVLQQDLEKPGSLPLTYGSLCNTFQSLLTQVSQKKSCFILIDAIDQLYCDSGDDPLLWLPKLLPKNVAFILVTQDGYFLEEALSHLDSPYQLCLSPLKESQNKLILEKLLAKNQRTLTFSQKDYVLKRCSENGLPLYLRLAFQQARRWTSYDDPFLCADIDSIILEFLNLLSKEKHHGITLTSRVLGYLALTYQGISEDEILEVLSQDSTMMEQFQLRFPNSPKTGQLPFIVWARLRAELDLYLKEVSIYNQIHLQFYHGKIGSLVLTSFLTPDFLLQLHQNLCLLFDAQPLWWGKGKRSLNLRKLSALPYHLIESQNTTALLELIRNSDYFEAKIRANQLSEYTKEVLWLSNQSEVSLSEDLAKTFFCFIVEYNSNNKKQPILWETLHNLLIFNLNRNFHYLLFTFGDSIESIQNLLPHLPTNEAKKISMECNAKRINYFRRKGDLAFSEKLGHQLLLMLSTKEQLRERSRVLYDLGYTQFLQGKFDVAYNTMLESATASLNAGSIVGQQISLCVGFHIRSVGALFTQNQETYLEEYEQVLKSAKSIFESCSSSSSTASISASDKLNARRWLANISEHLAMIAFNRGDLKALRQASNDYTNNPWVKEYDNKANLTFIKVRLMALEGHYTQACTYMEEYIQYLLEASSISNTRIESFSQPLLLLGRWQLLSGDFTAAKKSWEWATSLDDEPGNHIWKEEAFKQLQLLS